MGGGSAAPLFMRCELSLVDAGSARGGGCGPLEWEVEHQEPAEYEDTLQRVEQGKEVDDGQAQRCEDSQPPCHAQQSREAQHGEHCLPVLALLLACCGTWHSEDLPSYQTQDHGIAEEGDDKVAVDSGVEGSFLTEPAPERGVGTGSGNGSPWPVSWGWGSLSC